jgi:hypothetical protein
MMSNPDEPHPAPDSFSDLPMQPTGSGVADLEIAFEQMKLSEADDSAAHPTDDGTDAISHSPDTAEAESEGHPS